MDDRERDDADTDRDEHSGDDETGDKRREHDRSRRDDSDGGDRDADKNKDADGDEDGDADGDKDGDNDEDEGPRKPPPYKRPVFWIVVAIVATVLIVGGVLFWLYKRQYQSTDDAFVDAHIVRIAAQVEGKLTHVAAADNRHVEPGALLATIEPQGPQANLAQARAQALQAEAQIQQAEAQAESARAQRAQASAQARGPDAQAVKAAQDLARYEALRRLDPQAVAATQLDQAREQARSTAAQAAAAHRQVDSADAQVAVAQKQIRAARAQKAAAEAQVAQAQVTFGYLSIRAPVGGQLVNRSVNKGSYVSAGTQLMAIVPDQLYITANFKETQLTLMRPGQPVSIKVDAFPDVDFQGHVDSIQRGAGQAFQLLPPQNATGNFVKVVQRVPVRILFDRPDPHRYAIGPGMSVVPTVKVR